MILELWKDKGRIKPMTYDNWKTHDPADTDKHVTCKTCNGTGRSTEFKRAVRHWDRLNKHLEALLAVTDLRPSHIIDSVSVKSRMLLARERGTCEICNGEGSIYQGNYD